jgi:hypothetical protein
MIDEIHVLVTYRDPSGRKAAFIQPIDVRNREVATVNDEFPVTRTVRSRRRFVRVKFDGNPTSYTYNIDPDEADRLDVGDRVAVDSPLTGRVEYPRIREFPRTVHKAKKWARAIPLPEPSKLSYPADTVIRREDGSVQMLDFKTEEDLWLEVTVPSRTVLHLGDGAQVENSSLNDVKIKIPRMARP